MTNSNLKNGILHKFKYPRDVFGWYKSAEVHTHKASIPMRVLMIPVLFALVIASIWWAYHVMVEKHRGKSPESSGAVGVSSGGGLLSGGGGAKVMTVAEYVQSYQPRVSGLEYTAPAYDQVTRPVRAPVPAACMATSKRCACYSQQATRLDMPEAVCRGFVAGGFFDAFGHVDDERASAPVRDIGPGAPVPVVVNGPVAMPDRGVASLASAARVETLRR